MTFGDLLVMAGPMLAGMLIFIAAAIFSGRHVGRGLLNAAPVLGLMLRPMAVSTATETRRLQPQVYP